MLQLSAASFSYAEKDVLLTQRIHHPVHLIQNKAKDWNVDGVGNCGGKQRKAR